MYGWGSSSLLPDLFQIAVNKHEMMSDYLATDTGLKRSVQNWELIYQQYVCSAAFSTVSAWDGSSELEAQEKWCFLFQSTCIRKSSEKRCHAKSPSFPWKAIWRVKLWRPLWEKLFVWAASLGKILTTDNLIKQGMVMVSCCMCKSSEGPGRLPVHCSFS